MDILKLISHFEQMGILNYLLMSSLGPLRVFSIDPLLLLLLLEPVYLSLDCLRFQANITDSLPDFI